MFLYKKFSCLTVSSSTVEELWRR